MPRSTRYTAPFTVQQPSGPVGRVWVFAGTSLDTSQWTKTSVGGGNIANNHQRQYNPSYVTVHDGYLDFKLTQTRGQVGTNPNGVISTYAGIKSNEVFGYGSYEFYARVGSTALTPTGLGVQKSGTQSGLWNWINNSQTEIDFEQYGNWMDVTEVTVWKNPSPSQPPTSNDYTETHFTVTNMATQFHLYRFDWSATKVDFYVDSIVRATITTDVPSTPANIWAMLAGQNTPTNLASIGVEQHLYVNWIRYTPVGGTPLPIPT